MAMWRPAQEKEDVPVAVEFQRRSGVNYLKTVVAATSGAGVSVMV